MIDFLFFVVEYFDSVQYCTVISPENTQYTSLYIYKKNKVYSRDQINRD